MIIIVVPFCFNAKSNFIKLSLELQSRPAIGSSKIKYFGLQTSIPATATFLFSPPESARGDLSLILSKSRPKSSSVSLALLYFSS